MDEVYEPTPRMLDVNHIKQLVTLVVRLEAGKSPISVGVNKTCFQISADPDKLVYPLVGYYRQFIAVSAAAVHAPLSFSPSSASTTNKLTGSNVDVSGEERAATIGNSNKRPKSKLLNGHLLTYPIRSESTDEELAAILENQVIRIENVLSSLELRSLGPIYDVLLALGDAVKVQPNVLLHALEAFGLASNAAGLF